MAKHSNRCSRCKRLILCSAIVLFSSCSARQYIFLSGDGSGSLRFKIDLSASLYEYIEGLGSVDRKSFDKNDPFGVPRLKAEIEKVGKVRVKNISAPSPKVLEGELEFSDIDAFARSDAGSPSGGILSFSKKGSEKTLRISINKESIRASKALSSVRENELFRMFGPYENEGLSEAEYLEMMEWTLTEEGARLIPSSYVYLDITVPSSVLAQTGGTVKGKTVSFRIPLIDLLLLNKPLSYTVTYL